VLISLATILTGIPATAGDPASTRTVYAIVIGLMLVGLVLVALGIWLIRQTRIDPELLGPLEQMANRRWRKLDPVGRRRLLDDARPEGAEPVRRTPTEPEVDHDFERSDPPVPSFDDLEAIIAESPGADEQEPAAATVSDLDVVIDADAGVSESSGEADDDDSEVFAGDRRGEPATSEDDR
jgi:hypothetical protein